jgi:hypothetical protein
LKGSIEELNATIMTKNAQITGLDNKINRYQLTIDQLSNVFSMGYDDVNGNGQGIYR